MDFEAQRDENLRYKAKLLADLQLESQLSKPAESAKQPSKKRKLWPPDSQPTRSSARIASSNRPSYKEDSDQFDLAEAKPRSLASQTAIQDSEADSASLSPAHNAEELRAGWTQWEPVAGPPLRDQDGTYHFQDFPAFQPNKSPEEVIREGCFGGSYFRKLRSKKLGIVVEDDWRELPSTWYDGLDVDKFMTSNVYDATVNKYRVSCGQSIEEWEANGWINLEYDVRGWFQWYCRFFLGRRCDDDARQVSRWRKCVGPTGRWRSMLLKKYSSLGVRTVDIANKDVSPVMHQTCHHWAYEVKQQDLDQVWNRT